MARFTMFLSFFVATTLTASGNIYQAKYLEVGNQKQVLSQGWTVGKLRGNSLRELKYPQSIEEHAPIGDRFVVELAGPNAEAVHQELVRRGVQPKAFDPEDFVQTDDEVVTLVANGPPENRIDLVFMGDGYTIEERDKFFADAKRLTDDMFRDETFESYLPVFNVHAVFRASNESGIGKNSQAKDTAYRLYRQGNTLRAIFTSNPSAARRSCQQAPDCDFPILMANDPYYGGLGGEFAITTSSPTSGTKVLRHELGHNFGKVGEEYDGGGYFGANNSSSLSSLKWKHWVDGETRAEPAVARYIKWPWHHLANGEYKASFRSDGKYGFYEIQYSASGIETDDTLEIRIDGQQIPSPSPGHSDREFVEHFHEGGFSSGSHEIIVKENVNDGNNWLSDLTVFEYGEDYNFDPKNVGAYPVFSQWGTVAGYRGTHETCLMRNMKSRVFCPICQENNWLKFFADISLIDEVKVVTSGNQVEVTVMVPPLGQFRETPLENGEKLEVRWYRNGTLVGELSGKLQGEIPATQTSDRWEVEVEYVTPEVRKDPRELLKERKAVSLSI